jgi:hypothetical protein
MRCTSQIRASALRTTLAIDDDILAAARHLAEREQGTLGEVISNLARPGQSLHPPIRVGSALRLHYGCRFEQDRCLTVSGAACDVAGFQRIP